MAFRKKKSAPQKRWVTKSAGFESGVDSMKGHVFDCKGSNDIAAFNKIQKELASLVQRTFQDDGAAVARAIRTLEVPTIEVPDYEKDDVEKMPSIAQKIWYHEWQTASKKKKNIYSGLSRAYAIAYKLCSPALITKLEGSSGFSAVQDAEDVVQLLLIIHHPGHRLQIQRSEAGGVGAHAGQKEGLPTRAGSRSDQ